MRLNLTGRTPGEPEWWCPVCGERARQGKPIRWNPALGPHPRHSHLDGTPLCPILTEHGYRPVPVTSQPPNPAPSGGYEPLMAASWYARTMAKAASDLHRCLQHGQSADLARVSLAVSDAMRAIEKVSRHMEVAALTAHPTVGFLVIRAGAMAEHAALAFAEVNLVVLLADHADSERRSQGKRGQS